MHDVFIVVVRVYDARGDRLGGRRVRTTGRRGILRKAFPQSEMSNLPCSTGVVEYKLCVM